MADGSTKRIVDVQVGDQVRCRDPQTGKDEAKTVTATIERHAPSVVSVALHDAKTGASETLTCTPEHPFFVPNQGWVEAGSLGIGTSIVTRAGPQMAVASVTWQKNKAEELVSTSGLGGYTVYNLTVDGDHTFFVGNTSGGTWVHNARPCINTKLPDRVTKELADGEQRTAEENAQARNFFERNKEAAKNWWSERSGQDYPEDATHAEHPRPLKDGGDPLYIEPGFDGPARPHQGGDFSRWGAMGGRPRKTL